MCWPRSACCARYWPGSGARHDAALSLGGFLARVGLTAPQIKYLVEAIARTAGDSEHQDRRDTAEDAAQEFYAGRPARGYPQIKRPSAKRCASQIAEWLEYRGSSDDDGAADRSACCACRRGRPVDLWAKFDPPTLPRGVLPPLIEEFAVDRGTTMGCDMSGIAVGALAVCAAAIPDDIRLQPKQNDTEWQESARLWVALVGDPSTMKTPIDHRQPPSRCGASITNWRATIRTPWTSGTGCRRRAEGNPKPKKLRAMMLDTTIESTQEILQGQSERRAAGGGRTVRLVRLDGQVLGRARRPEGSRVLAASYNGGSYTVDRITRGSVLIPNLSVSILGGIAARADPQACRRRRRRRAAAAVHSDHAAPGRGRPGRASGTGGGRLQRPHQTCANSGRR